MTRPRRRAVVVLTRSFAGPALLWAGVGATLFVASIRHTAVQELGMRLMGIAGIAVLLTTCAAAVSLAGAVLVTRGGTRRNPVALVALVPWLLLAQMTYPAVRGAVLPERAADGVRVVVLAQNLWYENEDHDRTVRLVLERRADVLVLTEFTPEFDRAVDRADVTRDYPHQWRRPARAGAGLAVLSRVPFGEVTQVPLSTSAVSVELRPPGARAVTLYAIHPLAPSDVYGLVKWRSDYRTLQRDAEDFGPFTVVAGDFNANSGHRAFRRLARIGGLRDAHDVGGGGLSGTWPTGSRLPAVMRLDHVMVGSGIGVERFELLRDVGSDHRGVEAWLRVPGP